VTTPTEVQNWLLGAGVLAQLAILGLTALYLRGKVDGDAAARTAARELELEMLKAGVKEVADRAIRSEEGLRAHLDECGRHYEAMTRAFERLERQVEALSERLGARVGRRAAGG
jgi:hypothetical protein